MPIERVSQGFKDISMTFQSNPLNDDLIAIKNENAIARSLRNIVFTTPGEKFFNQSFGSRITESLFENIDEITATIIVCVAGYSVIRICNFKYGSIVPIIYGFIVYNFNIFNRTFQ